MYSIWKLFYQNLDNDTYDNVAVFDGENYELWLITSVIEVSDSKYDAYIYSCHGGCHKNDSTKKEKVTMHIIFRFK